MIAWLASLVLRAGVPARLKRHVAWAIAIVAGLVLIGGLAWSAYALIFASGKKLGTVTTELKAERDHSKRVGESRTDERAAQDVTNRIGARTLRVDQQTDHILKTTIEDLRNALHDTPPAAAGAAMPPVAADGMLRIDASLNALVDRANRAAEDPGAAGDVDPDRNADPVQRP